MRLLLLTVGLFGRSWAFLPLYKIPPNRDSTTTTTLQLWNRLDEVMETFVVKTLFPEESSDNLVVDPDEVLTTFDLQTFSDHSGLNAAYKSLTNYLQLWARQLELQPDKTLTTPISATDFRNASFSYSFLDKSSPSSSLQQQEEESLDLIYMPPKLPPNVSMTLKFRPPKRYLSYKEQKSMEKGVLPDRKGAKVDAWSPGGIQLLVTALELDKKEDQSKKETDCFQLKLEARRCDIDKDTVIKYSSERAIIRRLKEAIRIWIKVRQMP